MVFTSLLKLVHCYITTSILIKIGKCRRQMFFSFKLVKMYRCSNELSIVNGAVIVYVSLICIPSSQTNSVTEYMPLTVVIMKLTKARSFQFPQQIEKMHIQSCNTLEQTIGLYSHIRVNKFKN
jgi:hypothetical protein